MPAMAARMVESTPAKYWICLLMRAAGARLERSCWIWTAKPWRSYRPWSRPTYWTRALADAAGMPMVACRGGPGAAAAGALAGAGWVAVGAAGGGAAAPGA